MKKQLQIKAIVLAMAAIWAGSAAADTLTPTSTPLADTTAPSSIPQTAISYTVYDNAAALVGTFTYNSVTNSWTGPAGWNTAIDPVTLAPIPGTLVINAGTPTQQTVAFPTPPQDPALTAGAPVPTTSVSSTFTGATTASSVLGAGAVITNTTVTVNVPGTVNVTAVPDPINYTYLNAANGALDIASTAAFNDGAPATVTGTSLPYASGSVTVSSVTPAYQTGNYTVDFSANNGTTGDLTGTLTGGSVELSGSGLFFNALTGSGTVDATTGVITTSITAVATTSITSSGIETNALTVNGLTTTNGIDNSGERITGLAAGVNPTDAVNKSQLDSLSSDMKKSRKTLSKGIASIAAMANIPEVDESKTASVGVGLGGYDSQGAIALGGSYRVAPNMVLKGSIATSSSGGKAAYGLGLSSSW